MVLCDAVDKKLYCEAIYYGSFATGRVYGTSEPKGGLVGVHQGTIESSHFDITGTTQIKGIGPDANAQAGKVQGSTGAPGQGAFVGWDFTSTWKWKGNGEWPTLAWQ